jgi:hypothetical protein
MLLPYEKDILKDIHYGEMKRFSANEIVKFSKNLDFPSDIVMQCLGKEYIKIRHGDRFEIFKVLYNMNQKFQEGIIIPTANYDIILAMAEFTDYKIMGFLDHFQKKEVISLKYEGYNKFKIVSNIDKPFMEGLMVDLEFKAHNDFYIKLTPPKDISLSDLDML